MNIRKRPPYLPGYFYHFWNRGAHRLSIFREEDNYLFVIKRLKQYCQQLEVSPIAYCLMPNHFHFLIRQDGEHQAGMLPERIFNSYSKAYNNKYDHKGTLFESRYKAALIENSSHLLHLYRYIHANPVKDGMVETIEQWPYSNYLEWIRLRDGKLVDREFIDDHFGSVHEYKTFVDDFLLERVVTEAMSYLIE
jgi:putative transposase